MVFLLISVVVFNAVWWFMPKRLTYAEMYMSIFFSTCLEMVVNIILDLKYHLYGYFNNTVNLETFIAVFGIYPAVAVIFTNFYPRLFWRRVFYILGWTVFSVIYEWAAMKWGYFYHRNWSLWYSALCYPPLLLILVGNLALFRKLNGKERV